MSIPCKVTRHTKTPRGQFNEFPMRFSHVHMDIVGPLQPVSGYTGRYIVSFIDRATDWAEAAVIDSITAEVVSQSFIATWFSRFGVPLFLTTDRGSQFESELFNEISKTLGFVRLRTTAYHPQANGKVERYHRTLKASIMTSKLNWIEALPIVMFAHRIALTDKDVSPFNLVTGADVLLPSCIQQGHKQQFSRDFVNKLSTSLRELLLDIQDDKQSKSKQVTYIPKELSTATHVWLRIDRTKRPLEAPYTGPHRVIKLFQKTVLIEIARGQDNVSLDRVKPCIFNKNKTTIPESIPQTPTDVNDKYCICGGPFDSDMIACDFPNCPIEWYHLRCLNIADIPDGEWFCQDCSSKRKKKHVTFNL